MWRILDFLLYMVNFCSYFILSHGTVNDKSNHYILHTGVLMLSIHNVNLGPNDIKAMFIL